MSAGKLRRKSNGKLNRRDDGKTPRATEDTTGCCCCPASLIVTFEDVQILEECGQAGDTLEGGCEGNAQSWSVTGTINGEYELGPAPDLAGLYGVPCAYCAYVTTATLAVDLFSGFLSFCEPENYIDTLTTWKITAVITTAGVVSVFVEAADTFVMVKTAPGSAAFGFEGSTTNAAWRTTPTTIANIHTVAFPGDPDFDPFSFFAGTATVEASINVIVCADPQPFCPTDTDVCDDPVPLTITGCAEINGVYSLDKTGVTTWATDDAAVPWARITCEDVDINGSGVPAWKLEVGPNGIDIGGDLEVFYLDLLGNPCPIGTWYQCGSTFCAVHSATAVTG